MTKGKEIIGKLNIF